MPNLLYTVARFLPFTKIYSADVESRFSDIQTLLNTTKLDSTNVQQYGLTRDRLAQGTADHVVINDGSGVMSSEAQLSRSRGGTGVNLSTLTNQGGKAIVVNDAESALEYGSPSQPTLTQSFAGDIATLVAGEAISANDAVCLALAKDGSNNNVYKVFKCDDDLADRRVNFLGFAVAAATVTAHIQTWTDSADLVTGNTITWYVNGRYYTQAFSTDNDTTLAAIATQIAGDPDVQSAVVTDAGSADRVITITGKGGLQINVTSATVTGGASQATVTMATTQAAAGQNVRVRNFGLLSGFSSLSTAARYYLSGTAGGITNTPTSGLPIFVGQALSSTQLFINPTALHYQFSVPGIFVRSHGATGGEVASGGTQDTEHFNFTSWSTGVSGSAGARYHMASGGTSSYNQQHHVLDGVNTSSSVAALHTRYNKSTWETLTNRSTPRSRFSIYNFSTYLYANKGSTTSGSGGGDSGTVDKWNGTSWTNGAATYSNAGENISAFLQGSLMHVTAGYSGGTGQTYHDTLNTSDVTSTATASPFGARVGASASFGTSGVACRGPVAFSYQWSGSWSAGEAISYTISSDQGNAAGAYSESINRLIINGGSTSAPASVNTSASYNGSAWASTTSSTNSRNGAIGSIV